MSANHLDALASAINRKAVIDGVHNTPIPDLMLSRFSAPSELCALVYEPCLCVVAKGTKEVVLAGEAYELNHAQFLLVSVDLPVDARVVQASPNCPYLAVRITLDPRIIGELLSESTPVPPYCPTERGLAVSPLDPHLLDAITRLVGLLDSPPDIAALSPLILREISYRVLVGPQGSRLRQSVSHGAPAQRISEAIRWLKIHFAEPLLIDTLAKRAAMSPSTFHHHFKNVTAMSPLQYQKKLRLQEARRLLFGEALDAAEAGFRVGYESPSQFSREYRRMFGAPPRQDVAALKVATH